MDPSSTSGEGASPANHWFLSLLRVWWTSDTVLAKVDWRRLQTPLGEGGGFLERLFVIQSLSHVRLFAAPWTAACQASLPLTISQSLLKLMSIEPVMPSNLLTLCHPFSSCLPSFQASGSFLMSQFFPSGGQSTGASASASVLPMNIQDWFLLGLTGWISLKSKGLSRAFSNTTVSKKNRHHA